MLPGVGRFVTRKVLTAPESVSSSCGAVLSEYTPATYTHVAVAEATSAHEPAWPLGHERVTPKSVDAVSAQLVVSVVVTVFGTATSVDVQLSGVSTVSKLNGTGEAFTRM